MTKAPPRARICFVCLGNICRSPTAEAIMKHLVRQASMTARFAIESAGTGDWHIGEPRDPRSREVGERRGIPLSGRAQQFTIRDFARFDFVVAMDGQNAATLSAMAPDADARAKISLLRSHDPATAGSNLDVPDPYPGGPRGFDDVFDICLAACRGLLAALTATRAGARAPSS